jgi:hypothetical protein
MVSDEEDSDKEEMNEERERDALADELFDGDGDESEAPRERVSNEFESLDVDEEDDEDGKLCYSVECFLSTDALGESVRKFCCLGFLYQKQNEEDISPMYLMFID